jgi:hypothetical protein
VLLTIIAAAAFRAAGGQFRDFSLLHAALRDTADTLRKSDAELTQLIDALSATMESPVLARGALAVPAVVVTAASPAVAAAAEPAAARPQSSAVARTTGPSVPPPQAVAPVSSPLLASARAAIAPTPDDLEVSDMTSALSESVFSPAAMGRDTSDATDGAASASRHAGDSTDTREAPPEQGAAGAGAESDGGHRAGSGAEERAAAPQDEPADEDAGDDIDLR